MHGHHRQGIAVNTGQGVHVGHERRLLKKCVECGAGHFPALVHHGLRGGADEFAHIVEALACCLFALSAQMLVVANLDDELAQEFVHGQFGHAGPKALDHRRECAECGPRGGPQVGHNVGPRGGRQQRQPNLTRPLGQELDGGVAHAAARRPDRAPERFVIGRVGDEAQIRHEIADLAAVVKADRAHQPVRNRMATARVFDCAALGIGAIQDDHIPERDLSLGTARQHVREHPVGFVALVQATHHRHAIAGRECGPQRLAHPRRVLADDDVGQRQDFRRGAIVLLQPYDAGSGEVATERENVLHVCTAPAVDGLIVVAHHADVLVLAPQQLDEAVLRVVGVLVLVHEHVIEAALPAGELARVALEQAHGHHEQVIEVHGVRGAIRHLHVGIHLRHRLRERIAREFGVLLDADELVLGIADGAANGAGRNGLGRNAMPLHEPFDHRELLVFIVDRERCGPMELLRGPAHDARTDRVKRAHPHALRLVAELARYPFAHFASGLVGERHRENAVRLNATLENEAGDARGEHTRLARAGAGEHEQRTIAVLDRLALCRIQPGEQRGCHG